MKPELKKTTGIVMFIVTTITLAALYVNMPTREAGAAIIEGRSIKKLLGGIESLSLTMTPQEPETPPEQPKTVKMTIVGDLMVHEWQANDAYSQSTGTYNFDYCFEPVKKYLEGADYTIGNLETTFAGKEAGYSYYPTFSAPDSFGEALKNAGFDFVTTANNHSNDKRTKGIVRTLEVLDSLGIGHTGTYTSQEARDTVFTTEINGLKFAFLSYSYGTNGIPLEKPYHVNIIDDALIKADIQKAKALNPDFIIVLPHMGNEYETYTRDVFKERVKMMLDEGADAVIASHPHVLQPMLYTEKVFEDEIIERKFATYSMGNFISSQRDVPREASVILNMVFEKEEGKKPVIKQVSYIPTWVKFVNAAGSYDIKVLSVNDTLRAHENGENVDLRPKDIARLKNVHAEISKMLYGYEIPISEIRNEYWIVPKSAP